MFVGSRRGDCLRIELFGSRERRVWIDEFSVRSVEGSALRVVFSVFFFSVLGDRWVA